MTFIDYLKKMLKKKVKTVGTNTSEIEIESCSDSHSSLYTEDNTSDYYKYLYD